MLSKKVILPSVVEYRDYCGFSLSYRSSDIARDLDKVCAYVMGDSVYYPGFITESLKKSFGRSENIAESRYFDIKYYKKGTVHLTFKDPYLWTEINRRVLQGKNWLAQGETIKNGRIYRPKTNEVVLV